LDGAAAFCQMDFDKSAMQPRELQKGAALWTRPQLLASSGCRSCRECHHRRFAIRKCFLADLVELPGDGFSRIKYIALPPTSRIVVFAGSRFCASPISRSSVRANLLMQRDQTV